MPNCQSIDPLVTPYVDGELPGGDAAAIEQHLRACPPCHSRVAAEQAVRALIRTCKPALRNQPAPASLRTACERLQAGAAAGERGESRPGVARRPAPAHPWRARLAPFALAASLVMVVGGAFMYQLTDRSARVMAAELTADHMKCLAVNRLLGTHETASDVESSMASGFDWPTRLPERPERAGLELVGARPCLYAEGRVAHIMYRHRGRPVSVFMLPHTVRPEALTRVMGHECAIWSSGDRTFVLIAHEPRDDVERMASFVQASLR
jgi:anti-sigma factor (TIGR02949 family)